jgi:hypothetical protein
MGATTSQRSADTPLPTESRPHRSLAEGQEFSRGEAKPQDRFQDRALAGLMAARGWIVLKNSPGQLPL